MFIRRLFYNPETGEALHSYMMQGDIKEVPAATIAAQQGIGNYALMEWTSPDAEVERGFAESFGRVTVDVSGEAPALAFDFSPLPEPETPETPEADMLNALQILGYEEVTQDA